MPLIYKITSPTNKVYIGQTKDWIRRKDEYKHLKCVGQTKLYNSLVKYGFNKHNTEIAEILATSVSQDELDLREVHWWKYYKDLGFEMLNLKEPGRKGKYSEESKKKMRGRVVKEPSKEKLRSYRYYPILMLSLKGEYIREFRNAKEASIYFNLAPSTYVCHVLSGKKKSCKGYRLIKKSEYHPEEIKEIASGCNVEINQYDLQGNFIKSFLSFTQAEKELDIKGANANISSCCRGKYKNAYGYIWKYKINN